jgi:hypothetical protein
MNKPYLRAKPYTRSVIIATFRDEAIELKNCSDDTEWKFLLEAAAQMLQEDAQRLDRLNSDLINLRDELRHVNRELFYEQGLHK